MFPTGLEYYISVRGNVFQSHDQMCLDWLEKAPSDLTQAKQADSLSKEIYSMSRTAPNKEVNLMNIFIRLDTCRT